VILRTPWCRGVAAMSVHAVDEQVAAAAMREGERLDLDVVDDVVAPLMNGVMSVTARCSGAECGALPQAGVPQ
jgi:hypothetical protein